MQSDNVDRGAVAADLGGTFVYKDCTNEAPAESIGALTFGARTPSLQIEDPGSKTTMNFRSQSKGHELSKILPDVKKIEPVSFLSFPLHNLTV